MHRVLWLIVAVAFVVGMVIPDEPPEPEGCPPRDTRVVAPYAVTGYWVIPRADQCVTQRMVEAVHAIGGDTLITFGPRFDARQDPDFPACLVDGRPCAEVPGVRVRQVYTYVTSEEFGQGMLRCPGIDRRIGSGGRTFYRLTLAGSCAAADHDLVLVATDGDGLGNLMREASAYGMTVFPGLPAASQREDKPWEPDAAHTAALNTFTARVLADYRARFAGLTAFGGVYQSFELAMRARAEQDPIISCTPPSTPWSPPRCRARRSWSARTSTRAGAAASRRRRSRRGWRISRAPGPARPWRSPCRTGAARARCRCTGRRRATPGWRLGWCR
ncbi:hypothetical protein ACFQQB_34150 [Nonomuraea rubra]|uniref:hypothetical protein n=1 Tax=Nonomuraea rubra TaxID=46180 RepID=UPI00361D4870